MHHQSVHAKAKKSTPLWQALLSALPIVGAFANPSHRTKSEAVDQALSDTVSLSAQTLSMLFFPVEITKNFPMISNNMEIQMDTQMGTEMALRMWMGDIAGRGVYRVASKPVKMLVKSQHPDTFSDETWAALGLELAKLLPLLGPYLGKQNWKVSLKEGTIENIETLAMLISATLMMMLSPVEMEAKPANIAINTSLMLVGMTTVMLVDVLARSCLHKTKHYCTSHAFWKRDEPSYILLESDEPQLTLTQA